mmetsp:Transcript_36430/g.96903  ORF Transcript_36430/g.96903 Transcript_36430/m.96903 type:complete len:214 (+) Transcript_36430:1619-2260(+)
MATIDRRQVQQISSPPSSWEKTMSITRSSAWIGGGIAGTCDIPNSGGIGCGTQRHKQTHKVTKRPGSSANRPRSGRITDALGSDPSIQRRCCRSGEWFAGSRQTCASILLSTHVSPAGRPLLSTSPLTMAKHGILSAMDAFWSPTQRTQHSVTPVWSCLHSGTSTHMRVNHDRSAEAGTWRSDCCFDRRTSNFPILLASSFTLIPWDAFQQMS